MITPDQAEELLRRMTRGAMDAFEQPPHIHVFTGAQEDDFRQALMEALAELINVQIGVR